MVGVQKTKLVGGIATDGDDPRISGPASHECLLRDRERCDKSRRPHRPADENPQRVDERPGDEPAAAIEKRSEAAHVGLRYRRSFTLTMPCSSSTCVSGLAQGMRTAEPLSSLQS